jgi:hypothetical protein
LPSQLWSSKPGRDHRHVQGTHTGLVNITEQQHRAGTSGIAPSPADWLALAHEAEVQSWADELTVKGQVHAAHGVQGALCRADSENTSMSYSLHIT